MIKSGVQPQNNKLFNLLVADRVMLPEAMYVSVSPQQQALELIKRHALLISAFPEILGRKDELLAEADSLPELIAFINTIEPRELLHLPGRLHEKSLVNINAGSGTNARKRQGSFYTPVNVIHHMIRSAFACLPEGNTYPAKLKILDPACGTGSFLLECHNHLVSLGIPELKAIKLIHGTDIDVKAVELARFTITLAVLSKTKYAVDPMKIKLLTEQQIRLGNALMQPVDQVSNIKTGLPVIRWKSDFSEVFSNSDSRLNGFDLVIGNPPYLSNKAISREEKQHYNAQFSSARGQYDLSILFMEQGFKLLKENGVLSFIISNKFMAADYGKELRKCLLTQYTVLDITDVSTIKTFRNTSVYPVIITVKKLQPAEEHRIRIINISKWNDLYQAEPAMPLQSFFSIHKDALITSNLNNRIIKVVHKLHTMNSGLPPKVIRCGLAMTGYSSWINRDSEDIGSGKSHPFIQSGNIEAFKVQNRSWIDLTRFAFEKRLRDESVPKLVIPGIAKKLTAAVDVSGSLVGRVYYIRQSDTEFDLSYLASLFNSILLRFYYRVLFWPVHLEGGYLRFNSTYIANMPVYRINDSDEAKRARIRNLINTGSVLMNQNLHPKERELFMAELNADVFVLYDVTPKEAEEIMEFEHVSKGLQKKILNLMNSMNSMNLSKVAEMGR